MYRFVWGGNFCSMYSYIFTVLFILQIYVMSMCSFIIYTYVGEHVYNGIDRGSE